jgi:hypothetical protein
VSAELRDPTDADAPALADLLERHARACFGEQELSEDEVRSWLRMPNLWIQVAERDGELVGYVDAGIDENRFDIDARTLEPEVARLMVDAAEAEARRRSTARGCVASPGRRQGRTGGLRRQRRLARDPPRFQMRIDFVGALPSPTGPKGSLRGTCARARRSVSGLPRTTPSPTTGTSIRGRSRSGSRSTRSPTASTLRSGGSSTTTRTRGDLDQLVACLRRPHVRVDLHPGTRPPWRRRGLATALLLHSFRDFRERGATRDGLGVDGENTTGAVRLYESVGMHVARRTDVYEKTV